MKELFLEFKDTITTICGIAIGTGTLLLGYSALYNVEIPKEFKLILIIVMAVSGSVVGWFTGKSPQQIKDQNKVD